MLKTNDEHPFMHQLKAVEGIEGKRKLNECKNKGGIGECRNNLAGLKEIFLAKFSKVEKNLGEKNFEDLDIECFKKAVKVKTGIDEGCCLFAEVFKGNEGNRLMAKRLEGLKEEQNGFSKVWEQEMKTFSQLETDLEKELQDKRVGYENEISNLKEKLQKLNQELSVYEKFLRISVKKNKDDFICTATKGSKEIIFSFICSGYFTTYIPIQVNFQSSNFLNYKIEDLNRQELNILFSRLLKLLHTTNT